MDASFLNDDTASKYDCITTWVWRECTIPGSHNDPSLCNSGMVSVTDCVTIYEGASGYNTSGDGYNSNIDENGNIISPGGGGSMGASNNNTNSFTPVLTPLEIETEEFFNELTEEELECISEGFGAFKAEIKTYFKNNEVTVVRWDDNYQGVIPQEAKELVLECLIGLQDSATPEEQETSLFLRAQIKSLIPIGEKLFAEHLDKCTGLNNMWDRGTEGPILYPEIAGVLTTSGAILETAIMGEHGGTTTGLIAVGEDTYYFYPQSEGTTDNSYPGTRAIAGNYYIPITAYIHTHSIAVNTINDDGVTGERDNSSDLKVKRLIPNINHYIIGDNTLGEMTLTSSNPQVILSNSLVTDMCQYIN